jgi:DNA-binding transcriptional MerR regulator
MDKSPDAFRTISEVAEGLEIPAHVLRFWESRFPQIRPVKRAGGRRYYRPADVALLTGIKRLLHDEGMTIRGVQKILREQGVRHVAGLSGQEVPDDAAEAEAALEAALAANFERDDTPPPSQAEVESAQVVALETALRSRGADEAAPDQPAEVVSLFDTARVDAPAVAAPDVFAGLREARTLQAPAEEVAEAAHWLDPELDELPPARGDGDSPQSAEPLALIDRLRALPPGSLAHSAKAHALATRLRDLQTRLETTPPRPTL